MKENVIENRVVKPSAKLKYPESLRRFVHPDLAFAAIFFAAMFVYALVYNIVIGVNSRTYYEFPIVGGVISIVAAIVAPIVSSVAFKKRSAICFFAPAVLAVSFFFDVAASISTASDPTYAPDITILGAIGGYVRLAEYPVVEGFANSGLVSIDFIPMPTILVSFAMLVFFVIVPSPVIAGKERGSLDEAKTLKGVNIAYIAAFAVIVVALAIFAMVAYLQ